ncbi:MAG: HNH endonuclease signature motif containing protein [Prosthecobacter sp.]|nr:HNH endonuclease signature motif containing protein [Prosthecobacter sp.]
MIDAAIKQRVRQRAGDRCEYCRLPQIYEPGRRFHIEHIIAKRHRGADDLGNLALSCRLCNAHKGTNLAGMDPDTDVLTRLFHPRNDHWQEHFCINGVLIAGITDIGRTTVWLLEMNLDSRLELRGLMQEEGMWP